MGLTAGSPADQHAAMDVDASHDLTAESLDEGDEAAWTAGEYDDAFRLRERAYSEYLGRGDDPKAAVVASILASDYYQRGDLAVGAGWQGTAAAVG